MNSYRDNHTDSVYVIPATSDPTSMAGKTPAQLASPDLKWVLPNKICVSGDNSGHDPVYIYKTSNYLYIGLDLEELLSVLRSRKETLATRDRSLSHLLQDGLVPLPFSVYRDFYILGIGDRLFASNANAEWEVEVEFEFPYFQSRSIGSTVSSTQTLLELLTDSLCRKVGSSRNNLLMLSSGKDSTAIALSAAEAGIPLECVTFSDGTPNDETEKAKGICRHLGLRHHAVTIPTDVKRAARTLETFFERSAIPCVDYALLPYLLCLSEFSAPDHLVIDGMGNDIYMGMPPKRREMLKLRLRIFDNDFGRRLCRSLPRTSILRYMANSASKNLIPGNFFTYPEARAIYPGTTDTRDFWSSCDAAYSGYSYTDLKAVVRGRHHNQEVAMRKGRQAAASIGSSVIFPWADNELANYMFNLVRSDKERTSQKHSKALLRRLLTEKLGENLLARRKRYFSMNHQQFFRFFDELQQQTSTNWIAPLSPGTQSERVVLSRRACDPKSAFAISGYLFLAGWYKRFSQ